MRTGRTVLALAVALALAAAGCSSSSPRRATPSPTPSIAASTVAKLALVASIRHFDTQTHGYRLVIVDPRNGQTTVTGGADPAAGTRSALIDQRGFDLELRIVGGKRYVKVTGVTGLPLNRWMLIDVARLNAGADKFLAELEGPATFVKVLDSVTDARETGPGQYAGTVDLTRMLDSFVITPADLTALGERAEAVPFEATLDDQRRLTRLHLAIEAGRTVELTVSDWGAPRPVVEPAPAEVVETPEFVYDLFAGR